MALAFDILEGEPDLSDRISGVALDGQPQTFAVAAVAFELPLEPRLRLGAAESALVKAIDVGMRHHHRDEVDIAPGHFAKQ